MYIVEKAYNYILTDLYSNIRSRFKNSESKALRQHSIL